MTIPGFEAAQWRYDHALPPDDDGCECEADPCTCAQYAADARDDWLIDRAEARREDGEGR